LTYCFKVLFWPGAFELIIAAFLTIAVALFLVLKKKVILTTSKVVLGIIILLFALSFITKESKLFKNVQIDASNSASNHPEDYYDYAWILYNEGDTESAKINLQLAIDELTNPDNEYGDRFRNRHQDYMETFTSAMQKLNNNNWNTMEYPYTKE